MDRSWIRGRLLSSEYINGVKEFMTFVKGKFSDNVEVLCPCSRCLNQKYLSQALVKKHILMNGMDSCYTRWIHHGEDLNVDIVEHVPTADVHDIEHAPATDVHDSDDCSIDGIGVTEDDNNSVDPLEAILGDLRSAAAEEREVGENEDGDAGPHEQETFYKIAMREAKRQLYPGCTKFSRFSFVVKLLHMKSLHKISNSAFTAILKLLAEAFPEFNTLPKSYNEAKSILKELGLGYESIHVCYNNCVLFRKKFAELDNCPVCSFSRWKDPERKKIPQKVLRHFPLVPRLKRLFATKEASEEAQWHKLKRRPGEKEMSHPADGEAWQDFDREYPDFAKDARNLRLGLATDGFNPFSEDNTRYSMWPVFVIPSHDCHILLQRILPAAMRGFLDKDIYETIAELGKFFRELCSRTLNKDVLVKMKNEIPIILVKLEKIFPPAFFDVMIHLAVHLPDEALLRGPVQYGWMYPIERRLYTLKRYVRNRARPEGSIAEAYIADECLTFCSKYMEGVETRFNRDPRNIGFSNEEAYDVDVFGHGVHFTSAHELVYDENSFDQMVWYVLNNCSQVEKYVEMFRDELDREGVTNIERKLQLGFQNWFRNHIFRLRNTDEEIDDDLFSLACGPDFRVKKYSSCIVNGVRFNTVDRDKNKKTQNSGVMVQGSHNGQFIEFFGTLKEIVQLDYNGDERSVVLFRCDWFKLDGKKTELKYDGFFKSINVQSLWYKNDCFILATQARKVFYLPDTKLGKNWQVVQTFDHRHLYNVGETEGAQFSSPAYQEDECFEEEGSRQAISDNIIDKPLNRDDEQGPRFDATEIARLLKERNQEDHEVDGEDDDTLMEYCSNDEEGDAEEVDSDDE